MSDALANLECKTNFKTQIYYFLVKFPVYERMLKDFESGVSHTEIFPTGQPFKSLYAVHSLREYIASQSQKVCLF